jgi:hypothetical protein
MMGELWPNRVRTSSAPARESGCHISPLDDGTAPKYEFLYLGYAAQAIRAQVQVKLAYEGK